MGESKSCSRPRGRKRPSAEKLVKAVSAEEMGRVEEASPGMPIEAGEEPSRALVGRSTQ